jgi:hypothetical protein
MVCVSVEKVEIKDTGIWYSTGKFTDLNQASFILESKLLEYCMSECVVDVGFITPGGKWKFHMDSTSVHPDQVKYEVQQVLKEKITEMFPDLKKELIFTHLIKGVLNKMFVHDNPPVPEFRVGEVRENETAQQILQNIEDSSLNEKVEG